MKLPKLLVFASGGKAPDEGGSGFKKLVEATKTRILRAEIVAVVSNHASGGIFTKSQALDIPFRHSPKGRTAKDYRRLIAEFEAEFVALSGWLGFVMGLDPRTTFNIHPAWDLQRFGGQHFHGHKVHEAVIEAYRRGEVEYSGVSMHFATAKYDDPDAVFFKRRVPILSSYDADTLGRRVNQIEHFWQSEITNRVVQGEISWDGEHPESIVGADIL